MATALCAASPTRRARTDRLAANGPELLTKSPSSWHKAEFRTIVTGTYSTPFDPDQIAVDAEIRSPSGRTSHVPAFFYQAYDLRSPPSGDEDVLAEGGTDWHVRFSPEESGKYSIRIHARDRSGTVITQALSFSVARAADHGFLRVSRDDPHYFEFQDGTPYLAIGENMVHGSLSDYERWLSKLEANGGNYGRLWVGYPEGLEVGPAGEYRQDIAWNLDKILELSERHGIYQKICIDYIRYISLKGEPRRTFDPDRNAYSVSNGGPCRDMLDFFALPEARRMFRNRLRYMVARWGYSTHVMAWELWNEIGSADRDAVKDHALVVEWNQEMCRYLKSLDSRHMTTNSLSSTEVWPEMWKPSENEFAQMHGYYYFSEEMKRDAKDIASFMTKWLGEIDGYGKPYLFAEYGIVPNKEDTEGLWDRDPQGVHLHNGLWAPLAFGSAGTGMIWWWHTYVDPKNLYFQFKPVAEFTKGIPWTTEGFQRAELDSSSRSLRPMGLLGKNLILLWLQNREHTWWNVAQSTPISPTEDAVVVVKRTTPGLYRIEYFDTWKGVVLTRSQVRSENGELRIPVSPVARDIAVKITRGPGR
ncbi:MAG: hypothetical protein JWO80_1881 [Bryobacterales bacterium]|nr:hypothetical protein [Bryobacterales bacterium]